MYDLEERTLYLAIEVRQLCKQIPKTITNIDDVKQVIRSSGSVGANYIEANESLGKKDFLMRIRISRKEARETAYWLKVIQKTSDLDTDLNSKLENLISEVIQISRIMSSIINKVKEK
jgi:four helix bundle protein